MSDVVADRVSSGRVLVKINSQVTSLILSVDSRSDIVRVVVLGVVMVTKRLRQSYYYEI